MLKGAVLLVAVLALVEGASLRVNDVEEVGDSSMTCAACEWVADEALKMLEKESTEAEILVVLEGLCDKIPFVGSECHKYVAEMGPTVIKMLEGMVSADKICQTLKLCTAMEDFDMENDFVKFIMAPQLGDDKCTMCVDGLKELQVVLKDKKMLDIIEATTTLFCANFPLPQCQDLMEQYITKYLAMAEAWDAKAECVKLKSCAALTEENMTEVIEVVETELELKDTPECDACIDGVKELKKVWADEDTQALVTIVVNEVCTVLGVPTATCSLVSGLILPQITSAIAALVPKDTCVKVGACTAINELGSPFPFSDDSFPCEFCEFMGEQALKRLLTNKTENVLIATAHKVCNKVPLFHKECNNAVDQYGMMFLNKMRDTDFHYLCGKFMLCDPEVEKWIKSLSLYKAIVSEDLGSEECDACMDGVDEIKEIFTDDDTQALIHIAIEYLCDSLHPKIDSCEKVLKMTFDGFLMQLAKVDNHDICAQYGMCPANELTAVAVNDDSFTCEYCEFIGDQVVKRVFNNETETIILSYTKQICAKIPSFFGTECTALVDEYGYYYLGELKKVLDIEHACEKFNLCNPAGKLFLETSTLVKVLTGKEPLPESSDGLMCDACETGLQYFLAYLQGPTAQANMKSYALTACRMYGMPDKVCEGIVFGLIEGLNKELSSFEPKIACVAFNMCPAPVYPMEDQFMISKETFPCDVCMFVGDEFVERVLTYDTVTKVLAVAREACAYVPLFATECTTFIDESGEDQIYKWISYININKMCSKVNLCHGNKTVSTLPPLPDQLEGFICDTCEFFGHEFIDRLLTNDTVNKAMVVARKVCSVVPLYSQECIHFIDTQGSYWLNLWISELDADNFCSKLTLCPAANSTVVEVAELSPVAASIQCDTCMFVGNEFVEKAFTEENIKMTLGMARLICSKVPVFSKECTEFIDSDGNELIHTLLSYVHVDQICAMIKLCPAPAVSDIFPNDKDGFICDTCEFFGHEFIQRLLTKDTREKTLAIARKGCSYVPLYSKECQKFIDDDGDYFLQTWINSLSVDRFCSKITLCTEKMTPIEEESIAESLGLTASIQCDVCMFVGNEFVEKALTDDTIGVILMFAHEACAYVPLFAKECMEAVEQDGEKLIRMAFSHIHVDQICGEIHLCPAVAALEETLPNPSQDFVCDTCQYFGHEFVERVLTKEARAKTLEVVRAACAVVPLYHDECQKVVDDHGWYYLNMWIDRLDMDGLCMKLKLCTPAFKTWYETSAVPQLINEAKMPDCDTCVEGFDELKKILHDPYTKDLIVTLTREACLSLPIPFCNSVMNKVVSHIEAAVDAINSRGECTTLGQCTAATEDVVSDLKPTAVSEGMCDTCVEGVRRVNEMIHDPEFKRLMKPIIEGLCDGVDHIPGCQMVLMPLLDWIVTVEIPDTMCSFFGYCSKSKVVLDVSSDFCDSCVEGVDEMKEMMADPTIRTALKSMAEELCHSLPLPMCNYFVDTFVDAVVDRIAKIDSQHTCSLFGVCSAKPVSIYGSYCEDCVEGLDEFKEIFADPLVKESMHLVVTEICTQIPIPGCSMILNKLFDYSIDKFSAIDSQRTCSFFGVCSSKPILSPEFCDDCVEGLDDLRSLMVDPTMRVALKTMAEEFCSYAAMPVTMCNYAVDHVVDMVVDNLAKIDSKATCSLFGVCSAMPVSVTGSYCEDCVEGLDEFKEIFADPLVKESMHLVVTEICTQIPVPGCSFILNKVFDYGIDKFSAIDSQRTCSFFGVCSAKPVTSFTDSYCDECVEGIEEFKEIFADPIIKESMHLISIEICTQIPIPGCSMIFNKIFDYSIDKLADINSQHTCSFFGVCSARPAGGFGPGPADVICDTCKEGLEELKEVLTDPQTKEVLKFFAGKACLTLPIPMCQYILDSYIDTLVSTLGGIDSDDACVFIGACEGDWHNAGDVFRSLVSTFPEVSAGPCDMCVESLDEVKNMVSNPLVVDVIKETVDEVCAMLPLIGDKCKATLEEYIDEAVEAVIELDSKTMCTVMGMC